MSLALLVGGLVIATLASLLFSSLTYSLRDFSRARLEEFLERRGTVGSWLQATLEYAGDLIFVTAVGRLFANILILVFVLRLFHDTGYPLAVQYGLSVAITGVISLLCSVAVPHAIAEYYAEPLIGTFAAPLHALRWVLAPLAKVMHTVDRLVRSAGGTPEEPPQEKMEQEIADEIRSVVEEGEKEGVVDEQEREMIESVIQFRDTTAGQIMTARPEVVGIEQGASLAEVKRTLEESGHSRIPVFEDSLDHIVGVLYARDLLKHLGLPPDQFNMRSAMRPAFYVPEGKSLRDLLNDFRLQKVHMAIVLDEYGGTAGLVTIEDILEELVGEISDEHEPQEPAMLKRIDDNTWEADARVYVDELNRVVGLNLPEDAGYDTLGGFVTTTTGRIPPKGHRFAHANANYTILDAEPQKVNRVRIEMTPAEPTVADEAQAQSASIATPPRPATAGTMPARESTAANVSSPS